MSQKYCAQAKPDHHTYTPFGEMVAQQGAQAAAQAKRGAMGAEKYISRARAEGQRKQKQQQEGKAMGHWKSC
tara:strand:- start:142 stop:357 length:216 start_codon:yes stop_codon:yes gene_type:complete